MKHLTWIGPLLMAVLYLLLQNQSSTLAPTRPTTPTTPQTGSPSWPPPDPQMPPRTPDIVGIPHKAVEVLQFVRKNGQPMDGYVGGRVFDNREGRLPERGQYHEYDVDPRIRGEGRDAERLIIDQATGRAWYTGDHYRTFIQFPD